MRCLACDKRLNDRECTRKYSSNNSFVDLCDRCFSTVSDDIAEVEEEWDGASEFMEEEDERDYQHPYAGKSSDDC